MQFLRRLLGLTDGDKPKRSRGANGSRAAATSGGDRKAAAAVHERVQAATAIADAPDPTADASHMPNKQTLPWSEEDADRDEGSGSKEAPGESKRLEEDLMFAGVEVVDDDEDWLVDEAPAQNTVPFSPNHTDRGLVPVIVADVDGTLWGDPTSPYARELLPEFVQRIRDLKNEYSLVFCINSGMTFNRFEQAWSSLPDPLWPDHTLLAESEIYHHTGNGRYSEHQPFNDQSRSERRQQIKVLGQHFYGWIGDWEKQVPIVRWQAQRYQVVLMCPEAADADRLKTVVEASLEADGYKDLYALRNHRMIAITSKHYTKRRVLQELMDCYGWQRQQMLAMGDDVNDSSMLDGQFAFAACVGNAVPAIKEQVVSVNGYISQKYYGHGALDCIEWFIDRFRQEVLRETAA